MCIPPRSQTPGCTSLRGVRLRGVHHTAESSSAVCITPRSQAPRCASYRGVKGINFLKKLCGVHHTAESSSAVCIIPPSQAPRCASHCGVKLLTAESSFKRDNQESIKSGFKLTKNVDFFELCDQISRWNRNWIRKYFSLFIRGLDGFESWKKLEVENLVTHSL